MLINTSFQPIVYLSIMRKWEGAEVDPPLSIFAYEFKKWGGPYFPGLIPLR